MCSLIRHINEVVAWVRVLVCMYRVQYIKIQITRAWERRSTWNFSLHTFLQLPCVPQADHLVSGIHVSLRNYYPPHKLLYRPKYFRFFHHCGSCNMGMKDSVQYMKLFDPCSLNVATTVWIDTCMYYMYLLIHSLYKGRVSTSVLKSAPFHIPLYVINKEPTILSRFI